MAQVAEYWREHFDLSHIVERDWATLRAKLDGKMHVYCGTMDNYCARHRCPPALAVARTSSRQVTHWLAACLLVRR